MDYLSQRRVNLLKSAKADGVDTYLITKPANVAYLTGFAGPCGGAVIADGRAVVVADPTTAEWAAEIAPGVEFAGGTAAEVLAGMKAKNVGVEASHCTLAGFDALKEQLTKGTVKPVGPRIEKMREVKDPAEVEELKAAAAVADRVFKVMAVMVRETDTEAELAEAIEGHVRRIGGRVAGRTTVGVGDGAALADRPPAEATVAEGSKTLIEYGAALKYSSRLGRTVRAPFPVTPTRRTRKERLDYAIDKVHAAVLSAHKAAVEAIKDGVPAKAVAAAAHAPLRAAGLAEFAAPVVAHGIGLEPMEGPVMTAASEWTVEGGMALYLAPSVAIPGWGAVKIGDVVVVRREGAVVVSAASRAADAFG
jgi:Xaa-Pro aminopeptidase